LSVVEDNEDIAKIEKTLDAGQIEEVVVQAAEEFNLAVKMLEWKP